MRKTLILALVICFMTAFGAQAAQINKVAAVVNGQVITMFDLQKNAVPDLMRARINPNDPAQAKAVDAVLRKALDGHDHGHSGLRRKPSVSRFPFLLLKLTAKSPRS